MTLRASIAGAAVRVFGLDVRSLAALRIALGALLLIDLSVRASDFTAMYADEGIAPVRPETPVSLRLNPAAKPVTLRRRRRK